MDNNDEFVVVGSSIAALAAAERLAKTGHRVELHSTGTPGGVFAGIDVFGHSVEAGVRLVEREYVAGENSVPSPPFDEHIPGHGGHRRWMGMVEDYLCDLVPNLEQAQAPRLIIGDRCVEDFTLTGRVSAIADLFSPEELHQIAGQTEEAKLLTGHDSGIFADPDQYHRATLASASIMNHGELFHQRVVEPISSSLVEGGAEAVAADQRHKVWAPLYWPSTLNEAATANPVEFSPERRFWVDRRGGMRDLVDALVGRLRSSENARIVNSGRLSSIERQGDLTTIVFENGRKLSCAAPIVGVSPAELFGAAGIQHHPERVRMTLAWALVDESQVRGVALTTLVGSDIGAYRVSASAPQPGPDGTMGRIFCVEVHRDVTANAELVERTLCTVGAVDEPGDVDYLGSLSFDAFMKPTHENRSSFEQAHQQLRSRLGDITLIGGAAGYAADPLNEQLFSGMRAALEASGAYV